ncbi:MAG: limonene-1,2-epoxide hydrolase family protein [Alphaproteobacteria bacterium]|nr:limonene-1,2-epoxide hydrolase family protein [Alphaproteobacteria bacterium]
MSNSKVVADFIAAWEALDLDRIMAAFQPDAVYHNIPMPKLVGHDAIRTFIAGFLADATSARFETLHTAENANGTVLNERIDTFVQKSGKTLRFEVMGVFEFKDGKISSWRDYFDMKDVERQMAG